MLDDNLTRDELLDAQKALCTKKGWPHFAPHNGRCTKCGKDMVDSRWATEHITGCRNCHISYCE